MPRPSCEGETRACSKCGIEKPWRPPFFMRYRKNGRPHTTAECRECSARRKREARATVPKPTYPCSDCGIAFTKNSSTQIRCLECREVNKSMRWLYERTWRENNPERQRALYARWIEQNADRLTHYRRRRRARKVGAEGSHTREDFLRVYEMHGKRCYYCNALVPLAQITEDHLVPLSRGGGDGIDNIAPACRPCNCRKGDKTESEFWAFLERDRDAGR